MSKVVPHSYGADLPADTDIKEVRWYFGPAAQADFVASIDAANAGDTPATPSFVTPVNADPTIKRVVLRVSENSGLTPGDYQLCNVAVDMTGNFGDAYQMPVDATDPSKKGWTFLPLDFSAPGRCSNGSVD